MNTSILLVRKYFIVFFQKPHQEYEYRKENYYRRHWPADGAAVPGKAHIAVIYLGISGVYDPEQEVHQAHHRSVQSHYSAQVDKEILSSTFCLCFHDIYYIIYQVWQ